MLTLASEIEMWREDPAHKRHWKRHWLVPETFLKAIAETEGLFQQAHIEEAWEFYDAMTTGDGDTE